MISRKTIDDIFATALVEEVIGDFVHLKKSGSNYKGLSPFTDEKTPSFMVSPAKQIWKCFSTGKGGNSVSFLMEHEQFTYPEALRYLAQKYNISIEEDRQFTDHEKEIQSERESLLIVSELAAKYFKEQMLNTNKGKSIALGYFQQRGFSDHVIDKFELGYSPDEWTAFTDYALKKGYKLKFLASTGLTIVKDTKQFDRFKGRVMFPIRNFSGRIIAFGGRTLKTEKKIAKYLNSPESPIYHKSDVLYGIYEAKNAILKYDNCFLVEGYTDVISFYQSGVENVVSSSGTALTERQIKLIRRLTPNVTIIYDGDAAGIRASFRGIDLLLAHEMNIKVLLLPEGEDPDSFAKKHHSKDLKKFLISNQTDFVKFKTQVLLDDVNGDPIKRSNLIKDVLRSISIIPDIIKREVYIQETSHLLEIEERTLFNQLQQYINLKGNSSTPSVSSTFNMQAVKPVVKAKAKGHLETIYHIEKQLLNFMLLYGDEDISLLLEKATADKPAEYLETKVSKEIAESLLEDDLSMLEPRHHAIFSEIIEGLNKGIIYKSNHFINSEDSEILSLISDIISEQYHLHKWEVQGVHVKHVNERLAASLMDFLLNYKNERVKQMIFEIQHKGDITREDLVTLKNLMEIKNIYAANLNRIV